MARGFESKDVEFQQAEAGRTRVLRTALTPEQQAREARRVELQLSLAQKRDELARARVPAHRRMVQAAIAALEGELATLDTR